MAIDRLGKFIASQHLPIFKNYAFAFSLPLPLPLIYLTYGVILLAIAGYLLTRIRKLDGREALAWTLILAGSLSNVGERLATGYVKDFIYLFSGVFNFADFYILCGAALLLFRRPGEKVEQSLR